MQLATRTWYRSLALAAAVSALLTPLAATASFAQQAGPPPLPSAAPLPAEAAEMRARFQGMSAQEAQAAGYEPTPCVSAIEAGLPDQFGAMGQHFVSGPLMESQFQSGGDPSTPPVLLVDATGVVVGAEWEVSQTLQPAPTLFGINLTVQPGHEGAPDPHYMLHVYFRPQGMAVLAPPNPVPFDPLLSCTAGPPASDGRTLTDEPRATRALFVGTWGDQAAAEWVKEHNAALGG